MSTLTGPSISLSVQATLNSGGAPAPASSQVAHLAGWKPNVGTAAGQADRLYSAALTVNTGTPLVLDCTTLTDPLGGAINFAHVQAILISNLSTTAGQDLTIGGGTNPLLASESDPVQANGGAFCLIEPNPGFAVGGSAKTIQIVVAAGTGVPIQVSILGRST